MGTKVIDKLRIQGNAAPRIIPGPRAKTNDILSLQDPNDPCPFIIQYPHKETTPSLASRSNPSSAASRRLGYLQRVQKANEGLTSIDYNPYGPNLPNIQFLLRGKPVTEDFSPQLCDMSMHQRVGHYKTTAKEVYRARHKVPVDTFVSASQNLDGLKRELRYADPEVINSIQSFANGGNASTSYFYLGPPMSAPAKKNPLSQRSRPHPPHTADGVSNIRNSRTVSDGFALTGQQLQTPRVLDYDDFDFLEQNVCMDRSGGGVRPHINSPIGRRRHYWPRTSPSEKGTVTSDPALLKQCLKVQQSHQAASSSKMSSKDLTNFKHVSHYVRKDGVNYNNPYRNHKTKERTSLKKGRYHFNSVDSYIHFNKIYPKLENQTGHTEAKAQNNDLSRVPKVDGFSAHCTDTVLLKMMFEMNKPKSTRSVSKYSDVAVHKDLDEFMVVGTPSLSRSTSVMSKRMTDRKTKSLSSYVGTHKEVEEEDPIKSKLQDNVEEPDENEDVNSNRASENGEKASPDHSVHQIQIPDPANDVNDLSNTVNDRIVRETNEKDDDAKSDSCLNDMKKEDKRLDIELNNDKGDGSFNSDSTGYLNHDNENFAVGYPQESGRSGQRVLPV